MRALLLLALLSGCAAGAERGVDWERRATSLSGRWLVRYAYAKGESASGVMELTPNRTIDRDYPRIGLPTNYGTYDVVFPDLGGPPSGGRVPALIAGFIGADSVVISFETDRKTFGMQMRGALRGDSVTGTWTVSQSRGTIASGTFIMTRQ
jgi:hypothetical protein